MPRKTKTRETILAVATELFGTYGLNGVSTRQIAQAANVNKTLIFYHFQSKENLYLSVFKSRIKDFRDRIDTLFAETETGLPSIEAFVRAQIGFLGENRDIVRILIRELIDNESQIDSPPSVILKEAIDTLRPVSTKLFQSINEAREKGDIRDVDPAQTLVNIISLNIFFFLGQPIMQIVNPAFATTEFQGRRVDHVLDLLLNGLKERTD